MSTVIGLALLAGFVNNLCTKTGENENIENADADTESTRIIKKDTPLF